MKSVHVCYHNIIGIGLGTVTVHPPGSIFATACGLMHEWPASAFTRELLPLDTAGALRDANPQGRGCRKTSHFAPLWHVPRCPERLHPPPLRGDLLLRILSPS